MGIAKIGIEGSVVKVRESTLASVLSTRERESMRSIAALCRFFLLTLVVSLVTPIAAHSQPLTRDQLRARKLAARRFAGLAVALPDAAIAGGLRVCAKETPSGIVGYWTVPPKAVELIDVELLAHMRKSGLAKSLPFSPKLYVRQYVGYVRDGARFIYVNAVLVEKGSRAAAEAKRAFPRACDAVKGSWGIQYDTQAKKFLSFSAK
jgi:hypothetical protein